MNRRKFINTTSFVIGGSVIPSPTIGNKIAENKIAENKIALEIDIVAPSVVGLNETFSIGLRILTKPYYAPVTASHVRQTPSVAGPFNLSPRGTHYMENVMPLWDGLVKINSSIDYKGPSEISFASGTGPYQNDLRPIRRLEGLKFSTPGIKLIHVIDSNGVIEGLSNPIHVESHAPEERLFWGDLHMHSIYTDAIRIPEEIYAFARDETFLDICAMSEHSEALTDIEWNYFSEVSNKFNDPGRFVTLIGGEWTSKEYGHRNYYYRGDHGPIVRCTDPDYESLDQFYTAARSNKALVIPHHCANTIIGIDWSKGHDPEVERLVEIYSIWGNSERSTIQGNPLPIKFMEGEKSGQHVVDALSRGYRFGFIGGGDIHDGRPGDALHNLQEKPNGYNLLHQQGLMGVWAKDLTRTAIYDALWNRRVYATTNHRTWLKFSINGHPMGSQIKVDGDLQIEVEAASNSSIAHIQLVRNTKDIQVLNPGSEELNVSWRPLEPRPSAEVCYYIRLTLQDGKNMAWSSPIWISIQ